MADCWARHGRQLARYHPLRVDPGSAAWCDIVSIKDHWKAVFADTRTGSGLDDR
jgi:hypothetical protein